MADSDPRQFIKVAVDLPFNSKVVTEDCPALVIGAMVIAWDLCAQSYSDGHFQLGPVVRLGGIPTDLAERMIGLDIWHRPGHTCDRCPQPKPGWLYAHDYLEHQQSATDRARLSRAGRKAAAARWSANRNANRNADGNADRIADGSVDAVVEGVGDPTTQPLNPSTTASSNPVDNGPELGQQTLLCDLDANRNAEERRGEERRVSTKNSRSKAERDRDPHFTAWWEHYPRKQGKAPAWVSWQKALRIPGVTVEGLTLAAKRYAAHKAHEEARFVLLPATWLNQARWEDELPEPGTAVALRTPTNGRRMNTDDRVNLALNIGRRLQREHEESTPRES